MNDKYRLEQAKREAERAAFQAEIARANSDGRFRCFAAKARKELAALRAEESEGWILDGFDIDRVEAEELAALRADGTINA